MPMSAGAATVLSSVLAAAEAQGFDTNGRRTAPPSKTITQAAIQPKLQLQPAGIANGLRQIDALLEAAMTQQPGPS